jgi:hypothetical protein
MRRHAAPVVAGLVVAAYVATFRRYGIYDLADEGLLLAQAARAAAGERPYLDFHTGYGPLYFALQSRLLEAGGLQALRAALAVVHGVTAGLTFALARMLGGTALAIAAVALQTAFFLPLAPGSGAPFNVPYPAWYAGIGGVAVALLVLTARPAPLALAGAIAGAVFAIKPNSGALLVAGAAVASVLAGAGVVSGRGGALASATLLLAVLAVGLLVAPTGPSAIALVLVAPLLALVWRCRAGLADDATAASRLAALGAGFAGVAALALAPTIAALGPVRFAREVLHVGTGVAELFILPIGWPALLATVLGLVTLASGNARAGVLAGLALLALVVLSGAMDAPRAGAAARLGAERAALAVVPLALLGGIALLARDARLAPVVALTVLAAPQLYPRPDFDHLMPLAPLVLPVAVLVWRAAVARLGVPEGRATRAAVGLALLLAAGRFLPSGSALLAVWSGRAAPVQMPVGTLDTLPEGIERLRAFGAAAAAVASAAPAGERVLSFPACAAIPFLAGRLPAGPHDYFYPGRPTRGEVAELAGRLAAAPPPAAVTCVAPGRLAEAWAAYPELVALVEGRYRVVLEHPLLTVRRRID